MRSVSKRQPRSPRPFLASRHLALPALLVAALGTRSAHADCQPAPPSISFTYPDETTQSVPPDAVFWVVSRAGEARAWVDGVPLSQVGSSLAERHQFTHPMPLTEGEHEFVARAGNDDVRSLSFRVASSVPSTGDVSIDSVTFYPSSDRLPAPNPPDDEHDDECMQYAVKLTSPCSDTGYPEKARVTYEGHGDAIAYLAQGYSLVSPACATFWASSTDDPESSDYVVAAVLPTGVAAEHRFEGTIDVRTLEETRPDLFDRPDACTLGFGPRAPSTLACLGLALAAWLARRRGNAPGR